MIDYFWQRVEKELPPDYMLVVVIWDSILLTAYHTTSNGWWVREWNGTVKPPGNPTAWCHITPPVFE